VKKVENKTAFSKETVEYLHLIFWPGSQRKVHCHTAKSEGNNRPGPLASEISGSHCGRYEDGCLLGCCNNDMALCLNLCCSLNNQFLINKRISRGERKHKNVCSCI
jgi:hypothetical protein